VSFAGIAFDVRGLIQLDGRPPDDSAKSLPGDKSFRVKFRSKPPEYPERVAGIRVDQQCKALHFLHACAYSTTNGATIGAFRVRFADGSEKEVPIVYGPDVRDWWNYSNRSPQAGDAAAVWEGANPAMVRHGGVRSIQLFKTAWTNSTPLVAITRIDYESKLAGAAPFLVAITAEPFTLFSTQARPGTK
jgi:hypothetical protein